jgi:Dolichyl-phosphate-mannose-protein mannosyltransferase
MLFQALISLIALRNTAFQDEALYLLAGRQIFNSWIGRPHFLEPYGLYFSGYPFFYPVIGGSLDMLGGLETARMFSLLCMLSVTMCVYFTTKHFFDKNSAALAAALFACQGAVLFVGRLATYDALCLLLLSLAVVLALRVSVARTPWAIIALGPLLVLAVAAKYAGLLFVPTVFCILIWSSLKKQGWLKMLIRLGIALFSLAVTGAIAVANLNKDVLTGLSFTTTNRVSFIKAPPIVIIQHIVVLGGIIFALALIGLILAGWRRLPTGLLLFGSSLLAPAYHIYKGELVSLEKHVAFSLFFIMPLAGYTVARMAGLWQSRSISRYWMTGLAICLVTFSLGLQQAQTLYAGWAPSTNLTLLLRTQVRLNSGHYLAEDYEVSRYYLRDVSAPWQWSSLDFFTYTNKGKQYLTGENAYRAAIHDGYFDLIELSYGYNAALAISIASDLKASNNYDFIARIPYRNAYGTGYYWIWRKHVNSPTTPNKATAVRTLLQNIKLEAA